MAKKKADSKSPKEDKLKSEEPLKQTSHNGKTSPSDALVEHINEEGFKLKHFIGDYFILAIIGYFFLLLLLSIIFPSLFALILWVIIGFGIYKSIETYGEEKPWFAELSGKIQNFGFSTKKDNDSDNEVEDEEEQEEENVVSYDDYAEKFDEWRVTKDTIASPFVSAGNKVSNFSFNSKSLYKLRLWMFLILVPLLVWIIMWDIVSWPFLIWFSFWFSYEDAMNLGRICSLILSYFIIIRIYSHCTNNRNLPINSDMMADFDEYTVRHLFRVPTDKESLVLTGKAILFDFIGGYLIIIFTSLYAMQSYDSISRYSLSEFNSEGYPSLIFAFLSIAVFVPIMEELMFRGFVLDLASEVYSKWTAILISAILFALIHPLYILTVLNAFWAGLIYGYVRIKTNSLWPSILLHSAWNAHIVIIQFFA